VNALIDQPDSQNFLSQLGLIFWVQKLPTTTFTCQRANLPSLTLPHAPAPYALLEIPYAGDHIDYGELDIEFIVTEDMQNWLEIRDWLTELGSPENPLTEYAVLANAQPTTSFGPYTTATVTLLDGKRNPLMIATYYHLFPTYISELVFDVRDEDVKYLTAEATFKYVYYEVENLLTHTITP
jgi:hypothetical protein